jgi:hypothetical protein
VTTTVSSSAQVPVALSPSMLSSGWWTWWTVMIAGVSVVRMYSVIASRPVNARRSP